MFVHEAKYIGQNILAMKQNILANISTVKYNAININIHIQNEIILVEAKDDYTSQRLLFIPRQRCL